MTKAFVAVGADTRGSSLDAVAWALAECRASGADLVLVHALADVYAELAAAAGGTHPERESVARAVLDAHRAVTEDGAAEVAVTARLLDGAPADALIEASKRATLLVLGSRGRAGFTDSALGSIAQRVAVHAHCPVVVVPPTPAAAQWMQQGRIVVGVSDTRAGRQALEFAVAQARRGAATLLLVGSPGADAGDPDPDAGGPVNLRDALSERFPDVQFEAVAAGDDPVGALTAATRGADLVVLGCHHSDDPWSCRLGSVPSGVLVGAECPVALVGQLH